MISDFLSFDFETADAKNTAPCSLGITIVKNGFIRSTDNYLIDPDCEFSKNATRVHGITPEDVALAPFFPEVWETVSELFESMPVVAHNISFDATVLRKSLDRYRIPVPFMEMYDTYALARKKLSDVKNYKLDTLCNRFGIPLLNAHDSGCDSAATAALFLRLQEIDDCTVHSQPKTRDFYTFRSQKRSRFNSDSPIYQYPDVDYDDADICFIGKRFVITGTVYGYSRNKLIDIIQSAGGCVTEGLSSKTDYLVVGMQDMTVVKDRDNAKSGKILKAEKLREETGHIKIISAKSFIASLESEVDNVD